MENEYCVWIDASFLSASPLITVQKTSFFREGKEGFRRMEVIAL